MSMSLHVQVQAVVTKYENEVRERSVKKNPQYYHALRNLQWSRCLQAALNNQELPEDDWAALCGEKASGCVFKFDPKPGDKVLELLDKARASTATPVADKMHEQFEEALKKNKCHVEGLYVVSNHE